MLSNSLLNTEEAARFLRVSQASIRRWSDAGLLPARRVGRRRERRFATADLVQFLGQRSGDPQPPKPALTVSVGGAPISPRTHLAPIFSTDPGGLRLSIPFLAEGLAAGQPCFLAATGDVLERYVRALSQEPALDLDAATRAGRWTVVGWPGGTAAEALANWETLFGKALAGGPTILRIVGEMSCERAMFSSDAEMLAYEEGYEVMIRRYPAVTLCQYDAREFNGEVILRVLKAHPDMFQQHLGGLLN
ncbi:MAG TPA: MEDS domain-containing protein [Candidatus Dormibacteraeota bacterium]